MENKHTVYLNMCHHYRKIFNAKACVDSSLPNGLRNKTDYFRKKQGTSPFRPGTANRSTTVTIPKTIFKKNDTPVICSYFYQHHFKDIEQNYADNKSFVNSKKPLNPTTMKNDVQSKLRELGLHVYHPPRKKRIIPKKVRSPHLPPSINPIKNNQRKDEELHGHSFPKLDKKPKKLSSSSFATIENNYSEESSEDSAYNEGECILSSDSRGSTPQIATVKNYLTMKKSLAINKNEKMIQKIPPAQNVNEDIACIQFLKEITSDILKKNIFTNKALRNVFQHHMNVNKYQLDAEKIQKEVTKLQERLGIPLDNQYDDEDYGLGKDVLKAEILIESEETIDELKINVELPNEDSQNEIANHREEIKSHSETEEYEENYTDSFNDISQSDEEKRVVDNNSNSEEIPSDDDNSELNRTRSNSDEGENYHKNANLGTDSESEVSEEC